MQAHSSLTLANSAPWTEAVAPSSGITGDGHGRSVGHLSPKPVASGDSLSSTANGACSCASLP